MNTRVTLLYDQSNWIEPVVFGLMVSWKNVFQIDLATTSDALPGGDVCFYFNVRQIIPAQKRALYKHNVVIHAGDLPKDRGWSPYIYAILRGEKRFPVTLCEAEDKVDSGDIYSKTWVELEGHELLWETQGKIGEAITKACLEFMSHYPNVTKTKQTGEPTYNPRRTPADSRLDLNKTLGEQINLLRSVDNVRYPAWFVHEGHKYHLAVKKAGKAEPF